MAGVGEPALIVPPGASPHSYSLRPSNAAALQDADVVFWIGERLTPALGSAIETLSGDAEAVTLMEAEGTIELPFRENALFEKHRHDEHDEHDEHDDHDHEGHDHEEHAEKDHDHESHEDHDHDKHEEHAGHDDHAHDDHDHEKHAEEDHDHSGVDPHMWLSPDNASVWLGAIAAELSEVDPDNAAAYAANAKAAQAELAALKDEINAILEPKRGQGFVVFHDAYQYFETTFDFPAAGSISISDASDPSPARIAEVKAGVEERGAVCVLAEPQFNPGLVSAVSEGGQVATAVTDPLGFKLDLGPTLYPQLLRNLANDLASCL